MSTLTVIDLLKELKDGQEEIRERLNKLEENNVTVGEEISSLVVKNSNISHELTSLAARHEKDKDDLARKFEALSLAVNYPPGKRLASIPELLEMVLVHLPMKTLLLAQRDNRQFKGVIDNSKQLQRELFFLPAPIASRPQTPIRNPLLLFGTYAPSLPVFFVNKRRVCSFEVKGFDCVPRINHDYKGVMPGPTAMVEYKNVCDRRGPLNSHSATTKCYTNGSWRRMYVSQPPTTIAWIADAGLRRGVIEKAVTCGELWGSEADPEMDPMTIEEYSKCCLRV